MHEIIIKRRDDYGRKRNERKWFSAKRGYGFLVDADGIDYFVHYSEIQSEGFKTLRNNMEVSFMVEEDEKGRSIAKCVVPISEETSEEE